MKRIWEKERRGEEKGAGSSVRGDGGDIQRVNKLKKGGSKGRWETGGSQQKVPDARKANGSQDTTGMTLAEMPNQRERAVETISRG